MSTVDRTRPITIIGAGIGGLTAALELTRLGFSVEIFERAPQLEEVGAGLQLSPNALRVLDRIGLTDALMARGTSARDVILRRAATGRKIASVPVHASDGTPYLSIHRADLQQVLLTAVEQASAITLHLDASIEAVIPTDPDLELRIADADGRRERHRAQFVIGADGVRSSAAHLLGLSAPLPSGALAWRSRVQAPQEPASSGAIEAWLGPGRHAVAYPISGGRETNLVLIESIGEGTGREDLLRRFRSWDRRLTEMIARADDLTPWPMSTVPATRQWRHLDDRLILIGDAAHAMLPYAAQGAAMAIEDAAVLGDALARTEERRTALAHYEAERRPRIDRVRRRVGFHRFLYHLPLPFSLGRDAALKIRSPERLRADLGWLYDWRPPSTPGKNKKK